jgi:tetratricopeptide (TPR) repeat protein
MACVFRYSGDDDGYRQVVERALSLAPKAQSQDDLRRIIAIAALGPGEFPAHQVRQLDALLQTLQKRLPDAIPYRQVRGHNAVGLLQFRLGRFEESLAALARVGDQAPEEDRAVTFMVKAMTLQRLGRGTEAREAYEESESIMKRLFLEPVSEGGEVLKFTQLACLVLQRDTRALLGAE